MGIKAGERINPETIQQITTHIQKSNIPDLISRYKGNDSVKIPFVVSRMFSESNAVIYIIKDKYTTSSNVFDTTTILLKDYSDSIVSTTKTQYTFLDGLNYIEVIKIEFPIPAISDDYFCYLSIGQLTFVWDSINEVFIDFTKNSDIYIKTNQRFQSLSEIEPMRNVSKYLNNKNIRHIGFNRTSFVNGSVLDKAIYLVAVLDDKLKIGAFDDIRVSAIGRWLYYSNGDFDVIGNGGEVLFLKINVGIYGEDNQFNFGGYLDYSIYYRVLISSTWSDSIEVKANAILYEYADFKKHDEFDHNWLHQQYINQLLDWFQLFSRKDYSYRTKIKGEQSYGHEFSTLPSGLSDDRIFDLIYIPKYSPPVANP